jgi:hypothetical protein
METTMRRLDRLTTVLLFVVACSMPLQAGTRLIYPRVTFESAQFCGIAVVNPGTAEAEISLKAYRPDGSAYSGAGVTNPAVVKLGGGQQFSRLASEIFNLPASGAVGGETLWVELTSAAEGLTGFFLEGDKSLSTQIGRAHV